MGPELLAPGASHLLTALHDAAAGSRGEVVVPGMLEAIDDDQVPRLLRAAVAAVVDQVIGARDALVPEGGEPSEGAWQSPGQAAVQHLAMRELCAVEGVIDGVAATCDEGFLRAVADGLRAAYERVQQALVEDESAALLEQLPEPERFGVDVGGVVADHLRRNPEASAAIERALAGSPLAASVGRASRAELRRGSTSAAVTRRRVTRQRPPVHGSTPPDEQGALPGAPETDRELPRNRPTRPTGSRPPGPGALNG